MDYRRTPWRGLYALFPPQVSYEQVRHGFIGETSQRGHGRIDLLLTRTGIENLLEPSTMDRIETLVGHLAQEMRSPPAWGVHLMVVHPGAPAQEFHSDDEKAVHYWTMLFPLTQDPSAAGSTEFEDAFDVPVGDVDSGIVFTGKDVHRGGANRTEGHTRIFLYVAVFTPRRGDPNTHDGVERRRRRY